MRSRMLGENFIGKKRMDVLQFTRHLFNDKLSVLSVDEAQKLFDFSHDVTTSDIKASTRFQENKNILKVSDNVYCCRQLSEFALPIQITESQVIDVIASYEQKEQ